MFGLAVRPWWQRKQCNLDKKLLIYALSCSTQPSLSDSTHCAGQRRGKRGLVSSVFFSIRQILRVSDGEDVFATLATGRGVGQEPTEDPLDELGAAVRKEGRGPGALLGGGDRGIHRVCGERKTRAIGVEGKKIYAPWPPRDPNPPPSGMNVKERTPLHVKIGDRIWVDMGRG